MIMDQLVGLLREHYEWVFSGIGVALIAAIMSFWKRSRLLPSVFQRQRGGAFSRNVQVGIVQRLESEHE